MTDEVIAEEYLEPIHRMYSCNNENYTDEVIIQAYLDGLAEGRKEEQEKTCYCKHIQNFEKENAELKKDKEWLDNTNNEQTKVILELQAQIEKMKNDQKTAFIKGMRHFAKAMIEEIKKQVRENRGKQNDRTE